VALTTCPTVVVRLPVKRTLKTEPFLMG